MRFGWAIRLCSASLMVCAAWEGKYEILPGTGNVPYRTCISPSQAFFVFALAEIYVIAADNRDKSWGRGETVNCLVQCMQR